MSLDSTEFCRVVSDSLSACERLARKAHKWFGSCPVESGVGFGRTEADCPGEFSTIASHFFPAMVSRMGMARAVHTSPGQSPLWRMTMRKFMLALAVLALTMCGCELFERDHVSQYASSSYGAK